MLDDLLEAGLPPRKAAEPSAKELDTCLRLCELLLEMKLTRDASTVSAWPTVC